MMAVHTAGDGSGRMTVQCAYAGHPVVTSCTDVHMNCCRTLQKGGSIC